MNRLKYCYKTDQRTIEFSNEFLGDGYQMDPKANKAIMKLKTTSRNLKPAIRTGKITLPSLCTSTTARFTMSPPTVYLLFFTLFGRSLRRAVDLDLSRLRLHGTGRICPEPGRSSSFFCMFARKVLGPFLLWCLHGTGQI